MTSFSNKQAVKTGAIGRRHQRSRKEESEFGLGKKDYVLCPECGSIYFNKSWHRWLSKDVEHFNDDKEIDFELCPACKMVKDKIFEGELVVKFKTESLKSKSDVMNTVKNSNEQAMEKDPMDRILWTEKREDGIHIFTSENQLAVRIGKKLESSFPKSTLEIKHGGEDVTRVYWEY